METKMAHIQGDDETPDYRRGYMDGLKGRLADCPAGMNEDLYTEGYEAGQQAAKS
jgi:hypothetical protein